MLPGNRPREQWTRAVAYSQWRKLCSTIVGGWRLYLQELPRCCISYVEFLFFSLTRKQALFAILRETLDDWRDQSVEHYADVLEANAEQFGI